MKYFSIFFLTLILAGEAFSQHSHRAYAALGDSLFKHHNYQEAAQYYKRAIKNSKQPGDIMLKVARAYTETNNVKEAEIWYEKAKLNKATFSVEDTYHYVKELIMLERRKDAETVLYDFLKTNPDDPFARRLLEDLRNSEKYFKDSSAYQITPLSINTSVAEFAPEYYKDGIVFSSAQPQFISKKKYHWDNTHFLNLYYSARGSDHQFQKPALFDKEINTRFHDGPVAFYANNERMILNRNQEVKLKGRENVVMSHLTLLDVIRDQEKKTWIFTSLPFKDSLYSFAHPSISEDGNTLYFISDKPGGYGGTDIYRAVRSDGKWSEPFNLGPAINTSENETFPFFIDHTLYFASDGHGGLGGLDLFKSTQFVNGFKLPVNLGYPVNSHVDDFSLITKDHQSGYFSSARKGNDDLFEFGRSAAAVKMIARVYDAMTKESLPGATIQVLTAHGEDLQLTAGNGGYVQFQLPWEAGYILIANRDGKTGIVSGLAVPDEDREHLIHQVAAYGDTSLLPCIGNVVDDSGLTQNASVVHVIDETTGEKTDHNMVRSLVSFQGQKGHQYRIEVENEQGIIAVHKLEIAPHDSGVKKWSMVLQEAPSVLTLAARIMNAADSTTLGGARISVATLAEPDEELTADENGYVEFSLPVNAAYIIVGLKDGLAGMHTGFAEKTADKNSVVHAVYIQTEPLPAVPVFALVMNSKGEILHGAKATITNKITGEKIPGKVENGLLSFFAQENTGYHINIEHDGHQPVLKEINIVPGTSAGKIPVVLEEIKPRTRVMAARILKETDKLPLAGAKVKIITFSDPDLELIADDEGMVEFTIPEGEGYIIAGNKDGFTGMSMGIADSDTVKIRTIRPVLVNNDPAGDLQIFGMISDEGGASIANATVEVTDIKTGEKAQSKIENGILSFHGKRGSNYLVNVSAENYTTREETLSVDPSTPGASTLAIHLSKKFETVVKIADKKGEVITDATVLITDKASGANIPAEVKNGVLTFVSEQGKHYDITVKNGDHQTIVEELIVPRLATTVEPLYIIMGEKSMPSYLMAARAFKESDKSPLDGANIRVISFAASDIDLTADKEGVVEFNLPEGSAYIALAHSDGYFGMHAGISEKGMDKNSLVHPIPVTALPDKHLPVLALAYDENGSALLPTQVEVTDNTSGQRIEAKIEKGILVFYGEKGGDYKMQFNIEGYELQTENIKLPSDASFVPPIQISMTRKKLMTLPAAANLIILNNEEPRLYVTSKDSHDEIIEKDGMLYLQSKEELKQVGKGSLKALLTNPSSLIELSEDQTIVLENIYFDFNSALLDQVDKNELDKVNTVLKRYPVLELVVRAHADLRGSARYNLSLSRKRARAIKTYLVKCGVRPRYIFARAYGKSAPAVICATDECTEQQHQKNRRAEFVLSTFRKAELKTLPIVKPQPVLVKSTARTRVGADYASLLAKYGDRRLKDLVFKVCIGAYKLNPDLTFTEFTDLGHVEKTVSGGINYYYLQGFETLKAAEDIRQRVILRGISDAYIAIFLKNDKIRFSEFISLTESPGVE